MKPDYDAAWAVVYDVDSAMKVFQAHADEDPMARSAIHVIRGLLTKLRLRDIEAHRLTGEVARLRAGLPDGVTAEEWEILREIRAVAPPSRVDDDEVQA